MKRMTISAEVGKAWSGAGLADVCAVAEVIFDETRQNLLVLLAGSLRDADGQLFSAQWIPEREVVRKSVPEEWVAQHARDIFHAWSEKVRRAIPAGAPEAEPRWCRRMDPKRRRCFYQKGASHDP